MRITISWATSCVIIRRQMLLNGRETLNLDGYQCGQCSNATDLSVHVISQSYIKSEDLLKILVTPRTEGVLEDTWRVTG